MSHLISVPFGFPTSTAGWYYRFIEKDLEVAGHDLHKRDVSADMDKSILYRKTIRL
jgi:hypothetical protein